MADVLEGFTAETFEGLVEQPFRLQDGETEYELSLAQCRRLGGGGAGARDPFSLLFLGPVDPVLAQRTYGLQHRELGSFELFIVPVARDARGTSYEAVFT